MVAGDITLDWQTLSCPADPEQHLTVYPAAGGTPSHDALGFLASWAGDRDRVGRGTEDGEG